MAPSVAAPAATTMANPAAGAFAAATPGAGFESTSWQLWWNYNKDPYINLRNRMRGTVLTGSDTFFLGHGETMNVRDLSRPTGEQIDELVVPALSQTLENDRDDETLKCCMVALAKIGRVPDSALMHRLHELLTHPNQSVAETAVLSLGILAREAAVPTLVSILEDDREGWRLVDTVGISQRTRAFAAYALGIIGSRTTDLAFKQAMVERLVRVLEQPHFATRDIKIAAMTSLGLIALPVDLGTSTAESQDRPGTHVTSRQDQLEFLAHYFDSRNQRANKSSRHWLVRAHAPTAMARLLEDAPQTLRERAVRLMIEACGPHSKEHDAIQQSCVLALGRIGDSDVEDPLDQEIRETLLRTIDEGDLMGRRFGLIALAQTGTRRGQDDEHWAGLAATHAELLKQLSRGASQMKPWAALALGVAGQALIAQGQFPDQSVVRALRVSCADNRRPDECGAFMIALGLHGDEASRELLLEKLDLFAGSDHTRGDAAVALGLMRERRAIEPIQRILLKSTNRPMFLSQAALALGLIGDRKLVPDLVKVMMAARSSAVQGTVASALGTIGDSRSIDPLVNLLRNEGAKSGARASAAVALGRVCDRETLPWDWVLSADFNYNASPVTLTEPYSRTGVLDQL